MAADSQGLGSVHLGDNQASPFASYYPAFTHDLLWFITRQNEPMLWLVNTPRLVGMHLIEWIFSQEFRSTFPQKQDWNEAARVAVAYFLTITSEYANPENKRHVEYNQVIERLKRDLPEFEEIKRAAQEMRFELPPDNYAAPAEVFPAFIPFPLDNPIDVLEFQGYVQRVHQGSPDEFWCETYLPVTPKAKAALVLMHLGNLLAKERTGETQFEQLLWGLAVTRTIEEGLTKKENDKTWEPQVALKRIYQHLQPEKDLLKLSYKLRKSLSTLSRKIRKESLFKLLLYYAEKQAYLKDFLTMESGIKTDLFEGESVSNEPHFPPFSATKPGITIYARVRIEFDNTSGNSGG